MPPRHSTPHRTVLAWFSIASGIVGWIASFELLTEFIEKLKDPSYVPNCDVSVLVSCGPNMDGWQGSVFGFSNTILGIAAFTVPVFIGLGLLSGARFKPWFYYGYVLGLSAGLAFATWLQHESIFVLGTLCPWCMAVWAVLIPLWWISVPRLLADAALSPTPRKVFTVLGSWSGAGITLHLALLGSLAQLQLNWIAELT